jgi:hypothetical protein
MSPNDRRASLAVMGIQAQDGALVWVTTTTTALEPQQLGQGIGGGASPQRSRAWEQPHQDHIKPWRGGIVTGQTWTDARRFVSTWDTIATELIPSC